MTWIDAQKKILRIITKDTDLNSDATNYRIVLKVREDLSNERYGYNNETGFVV